MNILLYSEKVESHRKGYRQAVIPKNFRVSFEQFAAYKVKNLQGMEQSIEDLLDEESHMIRTDYIDEVSSITNSELDKLLDLEMG